MRLPMFPLGNVVLPGELLPLNVFEPRYRRLVLDCLAADTAAFGTTLIERGHEVGGGDERASIGTAVVIRTVTPVSGGRFKVASLAVRRLTVLEWLPDDPYPVADAEEWPDQLPSDDEQADTDAAIAELRDRADVIRELAMRAGGGSAAGTSTPRPMAVSADSLTASYQLAAAVPLGPADRFRVLQAPSVVARFDVLREVYDDLVAALQFRLGGATSDG